MNLAFWCRISVWVRFSPGYPEAKEKSLAGKRREKKEVEMLLIIGKICRSEKVPERFLLQIQNSSSLVIIDRKFLALVHEGEVWYVEELKRGERFLIVKPVKKFENQLELLDFIFERKAEEEWKREYPLPLDYFVKFHLLGSYHHFKYPSYLSPKSPTIYLRDERIGSHKRPLYAVKTSSCFIPVAGTVFGRQSNIWIPHVLDLKSYFDEYPVEELLPYSPEIWDRGKDWWEKKTEKTDPKNIVEMNYVEARKNWLKRWLIQNSSRHLFEIKERNQIEEYVFKTSNVEIFKLNDNHFFLDEEKAFALLADEWEEQVFRNIFK